VLGTLGWANYIHVTGDALTKLRKIPQNIIKLTHPSKMLGILGGSGNCTSFVFTCVFVLSHSSLTRSAVVMVKVTSCEFFQLVSVLWSATQRNWIFERCEGEGVQV